MKKFLIIILVLGLVASVWGKTLIQRLSGLTTTGISAWELVYISDNDVCSKADANIIKKACGIYMGIDGEVWLFGKFINPNWTTATKPTWEAGNSLFLSETAGEMTDTAPTTADSIAQKVGYVININGSSATIYLKPSDLIVINRE